MSINNQKILRTGDILVDKQTGKKVLIHYLREHNGQMSFESLVSNLQDVQVETEEGIKFIDINHFELPRRTK